MACGNVCYGRSVLPKRRGHRGKGKRGIDREPFLVTRSRGAPTPPARAARGGCLEQRTKDTAGYEKTG